MKILHVTEALAGGVAHSVSQLTKAQAENGCDVVLVHSMRRDTPISRLDDLYPAPIFRIELPMVTAISPRADIKNLLELIRIIREQNPDVIHLHSSKAGVLGRVAARWLGWQSRVMYSPRGFAFLREDVSAARRMLFLWIERVVVQLGGGLVACSASEANYALEYVRHPRVSLVENAVDLNALPLAEPRKDEIKIATAGRICYQKAPWRFKSLVDGCSKSQAHFVWIGDGDLIDCLYEHGKLPQALAVTGWLSREEVYNHLKQSDIFVLASLWEGMPLALIEAQAAGIPAVVSDVVGNRDVVVDGKTGFVCKTDRELLEKCQLLINDIELRRDMAEHARITARARFGVERMHRELMSLYLNTIGFGKA